MKQVLDAFNSLPGNPIGMAEFSEFWKSLTVDQKDEFKANAAAMGFKA